MNLTLRRGEPTDAEACGAICYEAFKTISEHHSFPPDFPNVESATGLMHFLFSQPFIYSVVAELDGRVVGSNFLWADRYVAGVGPITVDSKTQNASVGRQLMEDVLQRAAAQQLASVRLLQAAYHNRSFSLYTKLGFDVQEQISVIQGPALHLSFPGYNVRPAKVEDLSACNSLCLKVHGHDRGQELAGAIQTGTPMVVEHNGSISGYTTGINFFGHTVAATNHELKALIGAATEFAGPGFLLPARNSEVLRWCLNNGLRVVQPMTLMSKGMYQQPAGAFLPSVLY